ncbi:uncharacterized protein C6orf47 homolog [Spea bombifrons]|uniref:uncharacterized protein C6orf47 homolog n=1 Tax=Spea bombifrons TaxID=233779 RepID=UPI00234A5654|nr:uncharacterized protein C6orf47 homolog [Spea bombifrons]
MKMFLHRSFQWPSPPSFFSKLRPSSGPSPDSQASPQKPKRWSLPVIPLPSLPSIRSLLLYTKKDGSSNSRPASEINAQHYQICVNLVHHLIDICVLGCLWLFSPVFRVTLDVFGIQGAIKLWIHGLAVFLTTVYGMYLLLWLAQEYLFQLASLYGILQTLVLIVSLKAEREEEMAREEAGEEEDEEAAERREGDQKEQMEDRWAGGSDDEAADSDDQWVSDGEEEEVVTTALRDP